MYDWAPFLILALLSLAVAWIAGSFLRDAQLRILIVASVALRALGSTLRLQVMDDVYQGMGDAKGYYYWGTVFARDIANFDFGFFSTGPDDRWWGTQFVRLVSGFVVLFVGENIRAAFLAFALLGHLGVVLCLLAFRKTFDVQSCRRYAFWLLLWPALWFWPSSIGKEALMMLAIGLMVFGYVGRREHPKPLPLLAGIALAIAIRPHVAALLSASVLFAELAVRGSLFTSRKILGGLVAAVLAVVTLNQGLSQLGMADADLEGIQEEFEFRSGQTSKGGSRIDSVEGPAAIPLAFVNVLFRPFPWEARGISLLSSLEILFFWSVALYRRRGWIVSLRGWRTNPFLRVGLPFALSLTFLYGLAFNNLGIIARQRVVVFPFLLVLFAASRLPEGSPERRSLLPSNRLPAAPGSG